jgi:2-polyprenyl-3-methyl-5-hydroxy-6-metoxy-1,4-benzoquinol methylase
MNLNDAINALASGPQTSEQSFNDAIAAVREDTLDKFISTQFAGGDANNIEVNVSSATLNRLFDRIRQQWTVVGDSEPYVSVLADEKYSMATIDSTLVEFHETGLVGIQQLRQLAKKNSVAVNYGTCLELGCGVGRLTAHLAQSFQNIIAVDVSPGNMNVCRSYLQELGIQNVDLRLMKEIMELESMPEIDVFFSFIVIQHNPPPIQKYILDTLLSKVKPGGVFLFQTIVNAPGYEYSVEGNFQYKVVGYEMHALPMQHVIQSIYSNGLTLLDVIKDRQGGWNIDSYTFFGCRSSEFSGNIPS